MRIWVCGKDGRGHTNDLDLYIDLNELLGQGVNLDKTRVDGTVESTELGDQTDVSLTDWLVRVRADDAAWNSSTEPNAGSKRVHWLGVNFCVARGGNA